MTKTRTFQRTGFVFYFLAAQVGFVQIAPLLSPFCLRQSRTSKNNLLLLVACFLFSAFFCSFWCSIMRFLLNTKRTETTAQPFLMGSHSYFNSVYLCMSL